MIWTPEGAKDYIFVMAPGCLSDFNPSVPGVSHQGDLLLSPLTVLAHPQFKGKVAGVFRR